MGHPPTVAARLTTGATPMDDSRARRGNTTATATRSSSRLGTPMANTTTTTTTTSMATTTTTTSMATTAATAAAAELTHIQRCASDFVVYSCYAIKTTYKNIE